MLVEHAVSLPEGEDWEYEYAWAGERVLAVREGPGVRVSSVFHRRDLTNRFPVVAATLARLPAENIVIDGIVGTIDPQAFGPDAGAGVGSGAAVLPGMRIVFIASDLLWLGDADVRQLPLAERKRKLRDLIQGSGILSPIVPGVPVAQMVADARRLGAEAVIAKRRGSRYRPFGRAGDWVRVSVDGARAGMSRPDGEQRSGTASGFGFAEDRALGLGQMA